MLEEDSLIRNRHYLLEEAVYWLEMQQEYFVRQFISRVERLPQTNHFARQPQANLEKVALTSFKGICRRANGAPMHGETVKNVMEQLYREGISLKDWEELYTIALGLVHEIIDRGLTTKPRHQEVLKNKVQHVCQMYRTTATLSYVTYQVSPKKS
jgi:hypothetical protein